MRTIEFFWDPASPYTYLASTQIEALAARSGCALAWKPFLIGKAFEATGNRMPGGVPAKLQYMFADLQRWSQHYGVPLSFPKIFPINSLAPQRFACAVPDEKLPEFARALMAAYWAKGEDIQKPEVLAAIAAQCGLDGAAILARTQEQSVKDRLRSNTDDAVKRGAFGAPTFFVDGQMFWGNDRLGLLEEFLQGKLAA